MILPKEKTCVEYEKAFDKLVPSRERCPNNLVFKVQNYTITVKYNKQRYVTNKYGC
jgi:hypothetical protein